MNRALGLLAALLAVGVAAAPVHVPSVTVTAPFARNAVVAPAVWLPELDGGLSLSEARIFASDAKGIPIAFALDGGPLTLAITFDPTAQPDPKQFQGWVPVTNLAVGYGLPVGGVTRSVVTTGAYRFFVFDGTSKLDEVTQGTHLGATQATAIEPGGLIYTAYVNNVFRYSLVPLSGGLGYDILDTTNRQESFPDYVTALARLPGSGFMLAGVSAGTVVDGGALLLLDPGVPKTGTPTEIESADAGRLGRSIGGLAVYHSTATQEDFALVTTDGRLLLYKMTPTFGFVGELVIDGTTGGPYFQGLAISNLPVGPFDQGLLVVSNIFAVGGNTGELLLVRWDDLVSAVDAGLPIDTTLDLRTLVATPPGGGGGNSDGGGTIITLPGGPGVAGGTSTTGCSATGQPALALAAALVVLGALVRGRRRS